MDKKNKSSGLRILWIPGRKSHSKGHFNSTNKHISYSGAQKKSEVWTLGGSKTQNELLDLPTPEDSNNVAASSSLACISMSSTLVKSDKPNLPQQLVVVDHDAMLSTELPTLPPTPVAAISPNLNSPLSELAPSTPSTTAMASPLVVTKAEILDLHSILSAHDLPKVPHLGDGELSTSAVVLNSSAGTTASIATNSSPVGNRKVHNNPQGSPQKTRHKNYNNNQDDINSIESITSFTQHQVCTDFNWIDEMVEERNCDELMHKNKRKKSKKSLHAKSSSDQLDGLKLKDKHQLNESAKLKKHDSKSMTSPYDDNDEKVVKCLYYSLMCCDCTIS